jgi:hypothetical protein
MNMKELIAAVSIETGLPAENVKAVTQGVFNRFVQLIDEQSRFISPQLSITGTASMAKPESETKPARPERKFARLRIREVSSMQQVGAPIQEPQG